MRHSRFIAGPNGFENDKAINPLRLRSSPVLESSNIIDARFEGQPPGESQSLQQHTGVVMFSRL